MNIKFFRLKTTHYLYGLFFSSLILLSGYPETVKAESHSTLSSAMSQILSSRYSGYQYDEAQPVTPQQVKKLLEAARLAPSSYNEQPWHFIVCDRHTDPEAFEKALHTLVPSNQRWAKEASLLMICVTASHFSYNGKLNRWGHYDTGAAVLSLTLKATSMGLMTHQIGGFKDQEIREGFQIPEGYEPITVIAVGYPSPEETQPERERKPLGENFFMGSWGSAFSDGR